MTTDEILYELFQRGQMTIEEYMKGRELPSETIKRVNKAIKEYEINRK